MTYKVRLTKKHWHTHSHRERGERPSSSRPNCLDVCPATRHMYPALQGAVGGGEGDTEREVRRAIQAGVRSFPWANTPYRATAEGPVNKRHNKRYISTMGTASDWR